MNMDSSSSFRLEGTSTINKSKCFVPLAGRSRECGLAYMEARPLQHQHIPHLGISFLELLLLLNSPAGTWPQCVLLPHILHHLCHLSCATLWSHSGLGCCCWPWHAPVQTHPLPLSSHPLLPPTSSKSSSFHHILTRVIFSCHSLCSFCCIRFGAKSRGSFLLTSSHSAFPYTSTSSTIGQATAAPCVDNEWHCLETRDILIWGYLEGKSKGWGEVWGRMRWESGMGCRLAIR